MILVVGAGRSGTSQVCEILISLGVNMGTEFGELQESDNGRYNAYEDRDFYRLNRERPFSFSRCKEIIKTKKEPFGIKDPLLAYHLDEYLKHKPKIIYCTRNKEDIIKKMVKHYNWDRKRTEKVVNERIQLIESKIKDYLEIKFDDKDKEQKIKTWLSQ